MDTFTTIIDYLAAPPRLFALGLVIFLACRGTRVPWSRTAGWVLLLSISTFIGISLSDETFRHLVLDPERLPVVILVLSSVAVVWFEMRRNQHADRPAEDAGAELPDELRWSTTDTTVATGVGLALMLFARFQPATLGPEADPTARPDLVKAPWFFVGLQELDTYFDPWVSYFALPLLLVVGLLGLPYLEAGNAGGGRRRALFLLGWLLLWLWPMVVGALLRGPHWIAFGPFEAWDPGRPNAPTPQPLSEIFWVVWLRGFQPMSWWLRELPGILLLGGYFIGLPLALQRLRPTREAFANYLKAMGTWRFGAALAWVLAVMVVPLKMYSQWLWNIGYWIHLPELSFSF